MSKSIHSFSKVFVITSSLLIGACGSGSSDNAPDPIDITIERQGPLSTKYTGTWELDSDSDAIVMISQSSITTFALDPNQGCYELGLFNIIASTENTISSQDIEDSEVSTTVFALEGEVLQATEAGDTLNLVRSNPILISPACPNKNAVNSLEVTISLDYLPPEVIVNRDAQGTGSIEYSYRIHFDLNQNSIEDNGDLYAQLQHFKGSSVNNFSNNQTVNFEEIGADIWFLAPQIGTDKFLSSTNSLEGPINLQRNGNALVLEFNTSQVAQLANLSVDTPIKVSTFIDYPQPETEIVAGQQDGPWNWTSQIHQDTYPNDGFIAPNQENNHLDARGDLNEGQSQWVDIIEVRFEFR